MNAMRVWCHSCHVCTRYRRRCFYCELEQAAKGLPMWRRVAFVSSCLRSGRLARMFVPFCRIRVVLLALCRNWSKKPFYTMPIMKVTHLLLGLFSMSGCSVSTLAREDSRKSFYAVPVARGAPRGVHVRTRFRLTAGRGCIPGHRGPAAM